MHDEHRQKVTLLAFRRNVDRRAAELRAELPLLLGRLIAEVPDSLLELVVRSGKDGAVRADVFVEAGDQTSELLAEVAAIIAPGAELGDDLFEMTEPVVWPLVASARMPLGFRTDDRTDATAMWSTAGTSRVPELVELVSPHADVGVRVRLRASDVEQARPQWDVDFAVLTISDATPSLRLRAAVRTLFPGLEVAAGYGGQPAVLRVAAAELPAAFAVPVAGEEPIAGTYVGAAAPLPLHPTRGVADGPRSVRVGHAVTLSGKRMPVSLSAQERLRHIHVLGRTGTGKSSFLAAFANEVARTGDGMLVLDPHGHLVERVVAELPDAAAERTWVVRCGDVENPVPLNPMAVDDRVRREIAIDDVTASFQYLFDKKQTGIVGPRFRERVAMGLRALAAVNGRRASILDVPAALASRNFMRIAADIAGDDRLKAWVANDLRNARSDEYGEVVAWVNSKFEAFASTTAMRAILGSGEDALDMATVMDEGRIVLVDLSKTDLGESATRLLGYLYLNESWIGALQRTNPDRPFTVIVDEAQSMISGSLSTMLSEGRKFGLSVVLVHQYLGQLDEDLLPALDGNVATTVAFRGSGSDAPALRHRFGERVETITLMTLPDLSAVTLRTAADVTGEPYTLIVDHNDRVTARSGVDLAAFKADLAKLTQAALVDDYRVATAAAAAGKANVLATESLPPPVKAHPPFPKPTSPRSSFLEEWLERRQKLAASGRPEGKLDDELAPGTPPQIS